MTNGDWARERKTSLTPQETIIVAHASLILGVDQHILSSMFGINVGRINEAIKVMQDAAENHREHHRKRMAALHDRKKIVKDDEPPAETPGEPRLLTHRDMWDNGHDE